MDYQDLGQRIRKLRREHDLTQEELAELVGISPSFMGHVERGSRVASLETLVALCNVLKVSPGYLLEGSLQDDIEAYMPKGMSSEDRSKLSVFFRLAQDTIDNWPKETL